MKKILALILCSAMILGLTTSVIASDTEEQPTFVMRVAYDFDNPDPAYVTSTPDIVFANNVYSKLIKYDRAAGEFIGDLAEKWEINEEGTVYTFYLREDAKFQDGTPVKASDVVYSTKRVIDIGYQTVFNTCGLESYEATDDYTVIYTLAAPYSAFLNCLSGFFYIVSEAYVESGKDLSVEPMGSGAYKCESIRSDYEAVLTANEDYYLGAPEIKNVQLRVLKDASAVTAALETGDLSYSVVPFANYESLSSREDLEFYEGYPALVMSGVINTSVGPLADARVRLAMNYAINHQEFMDKVTEGFGEPAYYWLVTALNDMPEYSKTFEYDLDKAKELLAEAGYPDGFDLNVLVYEEAKTDAILFQSQMKNIGINCNLEEVDVGKLVDAIFSGEYEATVMDMGFGSFFDIWTAMIETGGTYNFAVYSNPEIDELVKEARVTTDKEKAEELYTKVLDIYMEDAPYIGLYQFGELRALNITQFKAKTELERDEFFDITTMGYAD